MSIRDLRTNVGEAVERAARGERITITEAGAPRTELRGLQSRAVSAATLLERWRHIPSVDPMRLEHDIEAVIDQSLFPALGARAGSWTDRLKPTNPIAPLP
ncbi:MAG: type II toxin-antitoxin system prevent-host-death family antitoxin [Solirubrobacterales bacterium]|nr:type II toxin-antitoxin system prevent-host-death family antitoxin [Solirubrobacterales bacterium]